MRLIDADAIPYTMIYRENWMRGTGGEEQAAWKSTIDTMPTIEPERKKGKWIDAVLPNDNGGLPVQVCDQCNTFFPLAYTGGGHRFCPNCGADMRGDNDDQSKR